MIFCGSIGTNGGGMAHYVGQEKLAPMESWSSIALAKDSSSPAVWTATYVACATVALPIPIGLAITSYNLFDVGWDTRRWVGRRTWPRHSKDSN